MKALIEAHGGKNGSSVSSKTTYLLAGTKPGPEKVKKAEELNIPIIDEATLYEMIEMPGQAGHDEMGAGHDENGDNVMADLIGHLNNDEIEPTLF